MYQKGVKKKSVMAKGLHATAAQYVSLLPHRHQGLKYTYMKDELIIVSQLQTSWYLLTSMETNN